MNRHKRLLSILIGPIFAALPGDGSGVSGANGDYCGHFKLLTAQA